ncbi:MAG: DUF805 domain-containing protein [Alphaproteobacteria bacterium]|nr:DUF805 domain-containing protein [Alphaproteobacteria bacterium]
MTLVQKLFSIQGRMRRSQYWGYSIAIGVVFFVIFLLIGMIPAARGLPPGEIDGVTMGLFLIAFVSHAWMVICITAKRCHDRDRSGWFQLISLIPIVRAIVMEEIMQQALLGFAVLGGIWLLIELGFLDGTQGENRFGPSPKGITSAQVDDIFR